jgi:SAM-dependent methyltransferase
VHGWVNPVTYAGLAPGDIVLELGSGGGIEPLIAAAKVGPGGRVIDIGLTEVTFERARANIAASGIGNVEVHYAGIDRLPVDGESVDWVIAGCALNSAADKSRAFAEIARVLKPGGRLCLVEIVAEAGVDIHPSSTPQGSCLAGARSEEEYTSCIRDCGLSDVVVGGRYVYDRDQLVALGSGTPDSTAKFVGRVWSAWFSARKPTTQPDSSRRETTTEEEDRWQL